MKPPAFQFYVDDFLGGTANFTDAEIGLYVRLLCQQWSKGYIIDSDEELLSYGRGKTSLTRIRAKFTKCPDGHLRNERMEVERRKQSDYRAKQSANGRIGASRKWDTVKTDGGAIAVPSVRHSDAIVTPLANGMAKNSSPSPSPSPSPNNRILAKPSAPRVQDEVFNALCRVEGSDPATIGAQGSRIGKCLKQIRLSSPDVTPEEIQRRAANYAKHFKTASISADALAKWWSRCDNAVLPGLIEESLPPSNLR
jgi:uncharacterized protein YdaU (DUF1376 family)